MEALDPASEEAMRARPKGAQMGVAAAGEPAFGAGVSLAISAMAGPPIRSVRPTQPPRSLGGEIKCRHVDAFDARRMRVEPATRSDRRRQQARCRVRPRVPDRLEHSGEQVHDSGPTRSGQARGRCHARVRPKGRWHGGPRPARGYSAQPLELVAQLVLRTTAVPRRPARVLRHRRRGAGLMPSCSTSCPSAVFSSTAAATPDHWIFQSIASNGPSAAPAPSGPSAPRGRRLPVRWTTRPRSRARCSRSCRGRCRSGRHRRCAGTGS